MLVDVPEYEAKPILTADGLETSGEELGAVKKEVVAGNENPDDAAAETIAIGVETTRPWTCHAHSGCTCEEITSCSCQNIHKLSCPTTCKHEELSKKHGLQSLICSL